MSSMKDDRRTIQTHYRRLKQEKTEKELTNCNNTEMNEGKITETVINP